MIHSLFFTLALPIIFILHNIDEYIFFDRFKETFFKFANKEVYTREVFRNAVILLSLFVICILALNYFYTNSVLETLTILTFVAISINGLQHCIGSLIYKKMAPGTISAACLILPFAIYVLVTSGSSIFTSLRQTAIYILCSVILTILFILISLALGSFINKLLTTKKG